MDATGDVMYTICIYLNGVNLVEVSVLCTQHHKEVHVMEVYLNTRWRGIFSFMRSLFTAVRFLSTYWTESPTRSGFCEENNNYSARRLATAVADRVVMATDCCNELLWIFRSVWLFFWDIT
jgi:hypothetical protein